MLYNQPTTTISVTRKQKTNYNTNIEQVPNIN